MLLVPLHSGVTSLLPSLGRSVVFLGYHEVEGTPFPSPVALCPDLSAMELYKTSGQGQPEAGALIFGVCWVGNLFEGIENTVEVFAADSDTGVGHRDGNIIPNVVIS